MNKLIKPKTEAIIHEDDKLYCCMASFPITKGHLIVAWKNNVSDLHLLEKEDYEYLMWIVEKARNALLKTFNLEKVYLIYMDELNRVHWHLVPRYDEKGFNILIHHPKEICDFSLVEEIKSNWS